MTSTWVCPKCGAVAWMSYCQMCSTPMSLSTGGVTTATPGPVIQALEASMRYLTAALVAALTLALTPIAAGHSLTVGEKKQQLRRYYKANGVVRWIGSHARVTQYSPDVRRKRRWQQAARFWVSVREDAWRQLHPPVVHRTPWPAWWEAQAACIRSHEGAWTSNTGNGYYGAYQFLLSTWQSVGGRGYPHQASPTEQTYRAWLVWRRDGGSWMEWGTRGMCGV